VSLAKNAQATVLAVAYNALGSPLPGYLAVWSSADTTIARVSAAGTITALSAGTTTVTATMGQASATVGVRVLATTTSVASVQVSPDSMTVAAGTTTPFTAVARDSAGGTLASRVITWTSSNTAVATVSSTGLVSAVSAGTGNITATSEGKSDLGKVTVTAVTPPPPPPPPSGDPALPTVFLNTTLLAPTGKTIAVAAGGDLQAAISAALPGDVITVAAGATFVGPFTLPNKVGTGWVTIRSDAPAASLPAEGVRSGPRYASALPKLVSNTSGAALQTAAGAHNYRIVGLEMTVATSVTTNYGIVILGDGSAAQNTLALVPTNIILDRVYVHGHSTLNTQRCVAMNSASTAVIDSYLSECHASGFDSQAIVSWNGPGPFKIVNNYLEGAGEIVMFGGGDPAITNLTPSDIEVRRNHFTRPPSWKGVWTVKNLFELKNAKRVLVEGNVFQNHWADAQDGFAIIFKSVNQSGTAPWCVTSDVTFRYNKLRNVSGGFNLAAHPEASPAVPAARIKISDNVMDSVNVGVFTGHGRVYQMLQELDKVTIEHNTTFSANYIFMFGSTPLATNFAFRNNVATRGQYGVFGSGVGEGTAALNYYVAPGYAFLGNVVISGPSALYPAGNFFPAANTNVGFVDVVNANYRLLSTSAYASKGTDGRDPGADVNAVESATQGVVVP
jgi:hypothetical protein